MATLATRLTSTGNLLVNGTFDEVTLPSGSLYFDGTGDTLEISNNTGLDFGSGEFTIETYVNFSVAPSSFIEYQIWHPTNHASGFKRISWYIYNNSLTIAYFGTVIASTSSLTWTLGTWYHLAVTRSGNTYTLWRDGVSVGTGTNTNTLDSASGYRIGNNITGYFSNLRVVKGTALYTANFNPSISVLESTANTSLLLNVLNSADYIKDNSSNKFNLTRNGDVAYNSLSPFNRGAHSVSNDTVFTRLSDEVSLAAGSVYFDGTTDYLSIPANAAFDFDSNDFTVEAWVYWISFSYINGSSGRVVQLLSNLSGFSGNGWNIEFSASDASTATSMVFYNRRGGTSYSVAGSFTFSAGRWYHLSAVRSGTLLTLYVNGSSIGSGTLTVQTITSTSPMWIGRQDITSYNNDMNGYVSNLRIVKGTALYTANFTPQQTILDSTANTSLLLNVLNSADFKKDNSPNNFTLTANGNTAWNANGPFNQNVTGLTERRLSNATLVKDQYDEFTGAPVVDSSLVLWLDAANPASYPETGTTWTGLTNYNINGTLTNGPVFSSVDGGFILFDGSNDYVSLGSSNAISGDNLTNITLEAWVKYSSTGTGRIITLQRGAGLSSSLISLIVNQNVNTNTAGYLQVVIRNSTNTGFDYLGVNNNYHLVGTYLHMVAVVDGTNRYLYVNNTLATSGTFGGMASVTGNTDNAYLGTSPTLLEYFSGNMSVARIYRRALTADEVAQNFNANRRRYGL